MPKNELEKIHTHIDSLIAQKALSLDVLSFVVKKLIEKEILNKGDTIKFLDKNTTKYYGNVSEQQYKAIVEISDLFKTSSD
ncbi:hypothetical protein A6046_05105 [[Haemophilus] ducreyi]|uniref:Uncharacterized protein n=2 Tax=Haemophilus ducreyi TaxID=730 RepID=Q7VNM2_HAEDU|nr:hypothetical protein [[Haemophilus] ducreyi]AAP95437.1 hypothetical protein HD_0483 [[Haemophilus] ducreyi 35000HP]AKO30542.1 hypothetical protein RY60_01895 [[Haemophilus] ducreyi]AKO31978.1 hypothetical protein RZ57_01900 [[Haemophilus] ducreyi]AKO33433.1 hypothetical protein RZ58_01900 [[Haemophilus] ducreyi]AKO34880.1 hypothetical protein RZ59_01885 [[Haemophilus] ducreyi]